MCDSIFTTLCFSVKLTGSLMLICFVKKKALNNSTVIPLKYLTYLSVEHTFSRADMICSRHFKSVQLEHMITTSSTSVPLSVRNWMRSSASFVHVVAFRCTQAKLEICMGNNSFLNFRTLLTINMSYRERSRLKIKIRMNILFLVSSCRNNFDVPRNNNLSTVFYCRKKCLMISQAAGIDCVPVKRLKC